MRLAAALSWAAKLLSTEAARRDEDAAGGASTGRSSCDW